MASNIADVTWCSFKSKCNLGRREEGGGGGGRGMVGAQFRVIV